MLKKRKKKALRPQYLSTGPLPTRLSGRFEGYRLAFSDASQKHRGGLAAILFADMESPPVIATCSVPRVGSNELELKAALFALGEARKHFPGERTALFSDNRDAVDRLDRARENGLGDDPELAGMLRQLNWDELPAATEFFWIRSHASCLGNALADLHAGQAANY